MKNLWKDACFGLIALTVFAACKNQKTADSNEKYTATSTAAVEGDLNRTILPIKEPVRQTYTELDASKAKAPARFEVKAPKGAPNVVVVLIDDIGFGASHAFGGGHQYADIG